MKKNKEILQSIETLDKKITQEERKSSKIVSENIRKEREGDRIKHQNDRQAIQDLKEQNHKWQNTLGILMKLLQELVAPLKMLLL